MGVNEDSNLSHSVCASNKEESQRTTTLTDNKKERLRKRRIFNSLQMSRASLKHWSREFLHVSPAVLTRLSASTDASVCSRFAPS